MSNHYHLALETPEPNLVAGMKWLQSTFATRFNRYRKERGHVFQGRYKALVVGEGRPLLGLVDYIHLNPVRAGLCSVGDLRSYALSSYPKYFKGHVHNGLCRADFLGILGLADNVAGMRRYGKHLELVDESEPARRLELEKRYCRGWFIGPDEDKKALSKDLSKRHPDVVWDSTQLRELNESQWEWVVEGLLKEAGKGEGDIQSDPKGALWKAVVARKLRATTPATNPWIANRLNMGHPSRITQLIRTA